MKNLKIICIEKDFVAWSVPNKTINISESWENQSKAIQGQIQNVIDNSHDYPTLKRYREEYFLN
jgi:hypothetical protein